MQTLSNWRVLRNKGTKPAPGPKPFKIGRMVRYFEADVDAWIEEQAKAS
ncbi:helix-turn-helix transcriptional regulator [Cryobacterium zongtaii]